MRSIIVDSSVALKWFYQDEEMSENANSVLNDSKNKSLQILVPELWLYEIANSFKSSIKAGRLNIRSARSYLEDLQDIKPVFVAFQSIMDLSLVLANKFDISIYDASYLALAKLQNIPFYTADHKLLDKIPPNFKKAYSLAKFQTVSN